MSAAYLGAGFRSSVSAMVVWMLAALVYSASASFAAPCKVTNLTTKHTYSGTSSNLQDAINAATSGTKVQIIGICMSGPAWSALERLLYEAEDFLDHLI